MRIDRFLYLESGVIFKTSSVHFYTFEFSESVNRLERVINSNIKLITIGVDDSTTYGELYSLYPDYFYKFDPTEDSLVTIRGKFQLRSKTEINGIDYILRFNHNQDLMIYSCFISGKSIDLSYTEVPERGCYVLLPSDLLNEPDLMDRAIELVNRESTQVYLLKVAEPKIANIVGLDLLTSKRSKKYNYSDTTVYDCDERVYLDEAKQISALIRDLMDKYPNIEFYTDPNSRDNSREYNESLHYESQLFSDDSPQTLHLNYNDPIYGRVRRIDLLISMKYETSDMVAFLDRRNEYMMNKFLTDVHLIYPRLNNGAKIQIGVQWSRDIIEETHDLRTDASGKYVYSFMTRCNLVGLLIEKYETPVRIDEVIKNFYIKEIIDG